MRTRKTLTTILTVVLALVLAGDALLVFVPKMMGYGCFAISGGSMEPTVPKGALVFTKEVELSEIKPGDMLTFRDKKGKTFFTHRVVEIDAETGLFTTRGDANTFDDPAPASYDYVVGKVVKQVSYLGYLHLCLTSPWGLAVILALLALWLGAQLYFVRRERREKA